jgi:predicted site-specific integrase-resolvase
MSVAGRTLLVMDPGDVGDDLVGDMTVILTSWCARRYGRRAAANRAARAVAVVIAQVPS